MLSRYYGFSSRIRKISRELLSKIVAFKIVGSKISTDKSVEEYFDAVTQVDTSAIDRR